MKLEIVSWKSEGLRCPDFSFDLDKFSNLKSSFVQMPNGTGKTTTLELLKSCLYDRDFKTDDISSYKPKKDKDLKDKPFFQTKFKIDGKIYSGAKAFLLVWKKIPKYKFLYIFFRLPIIFQIFAFIYELIAFFLYLKNRKQIKTN